MAKKNATHLSGPLNVGSGSIESLDAAKTLDYEDSGVTFILNGGTGVAVTLPAPKAGQRYKFVVGAAFTTDYVFTATGAIIQGNVMEAGAIQAVANATTITLEDGVEALGDYFDLESDGTYWYIRGSFTAALSVTPA